MAGYNIVDRSANMDLNMYQCGFEDCVSGHFYGPAVRDHFLIHYVIKGKGFYQVGEKTYHLGAGQGFLICPDIVTFYQADLAEPWSYAWVGFNGLKARQHLKEAGITAENPIFCYDRDDFIKDCLFKMIEAGKMKKGRDIRLLGLLYLFLSQLVEALNDGSGYEDENRSEIYAKKALEYIGMNYSRKISIAGIADYIGLDRSYFCSVFKAYLHVPPQEYLEKYRINKSCELLRKNNLTIGDVARSVGYEDPLHFSKVFRKVKGLSPRAYKQGNALKLYGKHYHSTQEPPPFTSGQREDSD